MNTPPQQYDSNENDLPQAFREGKGATDPGPHNSALGRQNPDILTPPSTDLVQFLISNSLLASP